MASTSKKLRVAINGFGRIGRAFLKVALKRVEMEVVAINDLGDVENMAYLLKYDSTYGRFNGVVEATKGAKPAIIVDGQQIVCLSEKDPKDLPWKDLQIDVVVESTGFFTSYEAAKAHIDAGAKRVVISAPAKGGEEHEGATVLMGINEEKLQDVSISSNASCTTNAGSPLIAILHEGIGIEKAILNTVHGYTASQAIVDGPSKRGWREGRAGAENIVPTSTGAASATTKVITDLEGKFDGISMRVPVPVGSIVDVTFIASRDTSVEEVNELLRDAAKSERFKGIFTVTDEEIVSSDIVGSPFASIADLSFTKVVDRNLVKVLAWYDNEMGYTHTLVRHVIRAGHFI